QPIPLYGDGKNIRDWLHVEDHCAALLRILQSGHVGEVYNIGGNCERSNLEVVHAICDALDRKQPRKQSHRNLITHVADRPGHDRRYALDASKLERELNWTPAIEFSRGLDQTVRWYLDNRDWCDRIKNRGYEIVRVGLGRN